jgi:hypothetical protein
VLPERSQHAIAALKQAGAHPKYTEYPSIGHGAWVPAYKDPELMNWLFQQKKQSKAGSSKQANIKALAK